MNIQKVGIILKKDSPEPQQLCAEMCAWFEGKDITAVVDQVVADLDMLVILGGDGTLLHVAAEAARHGIPVVGVNLGGLGFLTEIPAREWREALELILQGTVRIEERMMIRTRLKGGSHGDTWLYALNDVVVSRGPTDQLVRLSSWADDEYITTYRADGLVFATPTGSTAYNLSAGGPIVHPSLRSIMVTPICPFMLESRPVLLATPVRMLTALASEGAVVKVIVDGRITWSMGAGEVLEVESAENPLRLVCSPRKGYFEILRNKLNWGGSRLDLPAPVIQ